MIRMLSGRNACVTAFFSVAFSFCSFWPVQQFSAYAQTPQCSASLQCSTTFSYVEQFYPLWLTYLQSVDAYNPTATPDQLVAPATVDPSYQSVVAINVDTLYASSFVDLSSQPAMLTIPAYTASHYSVLVLDPYGDVIPTAIPTTTTTPVTYELTGPGSNSSLQTGVTQIQMPVNYFNLIIRADLSSNGVDKTTQAEQFRESLLMQSLSGWQANPSGGATVILPEAPKFTVPFKTALDALIAADPIAFLRTLQIAVHSPITPPMTTQQQALSAEFDTLFAQSQGGDQSQFGAGAQQAHAAILADYLTHTGPTNWINFTDIGIWNSSQYVDRSAIAEFIQWANNFSAAAYFQAFTDVTGKPLDGTTNPNGYLLTIPQNELPEAQRFWSFTAYTPEAVELIPNPANKYEVANYSPGLQYGADGSVTIALSKIRPQKVPEANWLPTASGLFNIMLRVYGPAGSVAAGNYVPPGIVANAAPLIGINTHDFNGDGASDVLWRDTSGNVSMSLTNGNSIGSASVLGNVPTNWSIVGQRDFNGDGKADILWRDSSGDLSLWFMKGLTVASTAGLGAAPINWSIKGTADLNGDGIGDLLWQDTAGDVSVWYMNGGAISSTASLGNVPTATWNLVGEDGSGNIYWRDTSGNLAVWQMSGGAIKATAGLGQVPLDWQIAGFGDFNGDGVADLLWRDTAGDTAIWFLTSSLAVQSTAGLGNIPTTWRVGQTGDYNGDGKSDILWIDAAGDTALWFMDGGAVSASASLGNSGTTWTVQAQNAE